MLCMQATAKSETVDKRQGGSDERKNSSKAMAEERKEPRVAHFFGLDVLARYLNWLVEKQLYPWLLTYLSA